MYGYAARFETPAIAPAVTHSGIGQVRHPGGTMAIVFYAVGIVLQLATIGSLISMRGLLQRVLSIKSSGQSVDFSTGIGIQIRAMDLLNQSRVIEVCGLLVGVACALSLWAWSYSAARNAKQLNPATFTHSPGRAVWWWFVPLANMVMPYLVLLSVYRNSSLPPNQRTGVGLVLSWWIIAWTAGLGGVFINYQVRLAREPQQVLNLITPAIATALMSVVSQSLVIAVIRAVNSRQMRSAAQFRHR